MVLDATGAFCGVDKESERLKRESKTLVFNKNLRYFCCLSLKSLNFFGYILDLHRQDA